jgi:hypothetical protein
MRKPARFPRVAAFGAAILIALASQARAAPLRLYLEAEDCDGLLRYPYDHEAAPGWYAREASNRAGDPGRGWMAALHETAANRTMTRTLDAPLPPGRYRLFLRTRGPALGTDTVVRVSVGKAEADFRWPPSKKNAWQGGLDIALTEPASAVRFTAVTFGGRGYGVVFEPLHPGIWLDTLLITDDLQASAPPAIEEERLLRAGVDPATVPPRLAFASDDPGLYDPVTPLPVAPVVSEPVCLQAFDGRRNIWPNGSFELGMNDGWTGDTRKRIHVFSDADLDTNQPLHGAYSLRVPAGIAPFSRPYLLKQRGPMTLSLAIRGDGPVRVQLMSMGTPVTKSGADRLIQTDPVIEMKGVSTSTWQRISGTGLLTNGWYYLALHCSGTTWVDSVQLEPGDKPTPFEPRAELEGALRSGALGNVLHDDRRTLTAWFHNSSAAPVRAALNYRIVDIRETVVAAGEAGPVDVPPHTTLRKEFPLLPGLRGAFSATYAAASRALPEGETVFAVMPTPATNATRHRIGGNMSFDPFEQLIQKELGVRAVLTCKSRQVGSAWEPNFGGHPAPDVWRWYDALAATPHANGLAFFACLWPAQIPPFMQAPRPAPWRCTRGGERKQVPEITRWTEYASTVTAHYRPFVDTWCIDDESENNWDPVHYVPFLRSTITAVRKAAPNVKLGLSATPEYLEELFALGLDPASIDWLGGSFFDFEYWASLRVARLRERFGKPAVSYGVGGRPPSATMYHTYPTYRPLRGQVAYVSHCALNQLLLQQVDVAGHYAAVIRNDGLHDARNKPLLDYDGSPLPWGAAFCALGTELADAEFVDSLDLGKTGRFAILFRSRGRLGLVTYGTATRLSDRHWRPAQRILKGLTLPCPAGSVELVDLFWNPVDAARWTSRGLRLDLDEEPVFFLDNTLGEAGLRALCAGASLPPEPITFETDLVPGDGGKPALSVTIENHSGRDLKEVVVDLRLPEGKGPWNAAGNWLLARPVATVPDLPDGGRKTILFPTVLDGTAPFECGTLRLNLRDSTGLEAAADDAVWLLPARSLPAAPQADGRLDEWESLPAAWLFYDFSWGQVGRGVTQIKSGGQYFSYPSYRLDARAAFWAGWNARSLIVAVRLEDDQPILAGTDGEQLAIRLRTAGGVKTFELRPHADGTVSVLTAETGATPVSARCAMLERTIADGADLKPKPVSFVGIEVAIPWEQLGITPETGQFIGFDLDWTDTDRENTTLTHGTLGWAGESQRGGYLQLGRPFKP